MWEGRVQIHWASHGTTNAPAAHGLTNPLSKYDDNIYNVPSHYTTAATAAD